MADRVEAGGGFTVLDGVALVTGAAVASVHVRTAVPRIAGPIGWFWVWCLFSWLALTSGGPFLFLVRRFFTKPENYPRLGDRLWALAGLPWLVAAMVQTFESNSRVISAQQDTAYVGSLTLGLVLVAMISVPVLIVKYFWGDPKSPKPVEISPWTDRLGLFLAVAWPIQCGVGLVVVG
jgi:hypothetical protein